MPPPAKVEIIPQMQEDGSPAQLSQEELVEVEAMRQKAEKMAGCPFFAGIKRASAKQALADHKAQIAEKKFSNKSLPEISNMSAAAGDESQDLLKLA